MGRLHALAMALIVALTWRDAASADARAWPAPRQSRLRRLARASFGLQMAYVNVTHKVLVCAMPKAANEAVYMSLRRTHGLSDWRDARKTFVSYVDHHDNGLMYLRQLPLAERVAVLRDPTWRKLAVVRNPWQRARSAYLNKVAGGSRRRVESHICGQVMQSAALCDTDHVPWETYLSRMAELDMDAVETNCHVASQTSLCGLDVVDYAYARVERLASDMQAFSDCHRLGWSVPRERLGQTTRSGGSAHTFPDSDAARLARIWSSDVRTLRAIYADDANGSLVRGEAPGC